MSTIFDPVTHFLVHRGDPIFGIGCSFLKVNDPNWNNMMRRYPKSLLHAISYEVDRLHDDLNGNISIPERFQEIICKNSPYFCTNFDYDIGWFVLALVLPENHEALKSLNDMFALSDDEEYIEGSWTNI